MILYRQQTPRVRAIIEDGAQGQPAKSTLRHLEGIKPDQWLSVRISPRNDPVDRPRTVQSSLCLHSLESYSYWIINICKSGPAGGNYGLHALQDRRMGRRRGIL